MTRETKIGLLVGLAFIIVIGILLSDHINSSTDPVRAEMTKTFNGVVQSVDSPNARDQGSLVMVPAPAPVIPRNPVPTSSEPLPPGNPGSSVIEVSPGGDPSRMRIPTPPVVQENHIQVLPPAQDEVASNDAGNSAPAGPSRDPLQELIRQHQNDLTNAGGPSTGGVPPTPGAAGDNATNRVPATGALRQIKAEDGDTVSRMAGRYMGGNNKANREAIIKANPSMTPDGHLVISGHTYLIPGSSTVSVAVGRTEPVAAARPAAPAATPPGVSWYTVKDNDSLWKIAAEQLGSGTRWSEIRDLNQDVLKGAAQLHANMRIKLPAKSVASTN